MKQIVFIFMAILLATGMASAQKKAVISAETTSFDFGTIKEADGKVSHTFEVSNTGDMPLVITRVIASCGCTTPEWPKEPVAAGAAEFSTGRKARNQLMACFTHITFQKIPTCTLEKST